MIERITKNEERLDKILTSIKNLEMAINQYNDNKKDIYLLSRYYGSDSWFKDKDAYENNKIPKIKAGVLGEDTVWNLLTNIDSLMLDMKKIVDNYYKNKN